VIQLDLFDLPGNLTLSSVADDNSREPATNDRVLARAPSPPAPNIQKDSGTYENASVAPYVQRLSRQEVGYPGYTEQWFMNAAMVEGTALIAVDRVRQAANGALLPERKSELGQFMTPAPIAQFMAALFTERPEFVRLLDAGAGVGSLTAAFMDRFGTIPVHVTAYEVDPALAKHLRGTLARFGSGAFQGKLIERDFIQEAVYSIQLGRAWPGFTHAIMNPPYKKINGRSSHRALLRGVGLETVNLYSAFVGLAVELMAEGGEVVAIVPRSFCNGPYYKPFRDWIFARCSLDHIHLFHSRSSAFNHDAVLQENVIIKLVRGKLQGAVTITTSSDMSFSDLQAHHYPFQQVVHVGDPQQFIHVPSAPTHVGPEGVPLAAFALDEIGLSVSTGPVVDFRLKEYLRAEPTPYTIPLLYPTHFSGGGLLWPRRSKKPNALIDAPETRKWVLPKGYYTVVRRFSSKEERRRIVAHVVDPSMFGADALGFENHLNVFHAQKHGLDQDIAFGLCAFLNSTAIDEYFRRFSGHTQVNATDLRLLRYPAAAEMGRLGEWARRTGQPTTAQIDEMVKTLHGKRQNY